MKRRTFLGAAGATLALPRPTLAKTSPKLNIGILGVGMRGQVHLDNLLKRDDVSVTAICDIDPFMIDRALAQYQKAGAKKPAVFADSPEAWREMLAKGRLDAVMIVTPWELHAAQSIAAMQAKVAVGCEVVAGITIDDHWQVLRNQVQTGTPYMLLQKCLLPAGCARRAQHGAAGPVWGDRASRRRLST
jgi:hypothetical protein